MPRPLASARPNAHCLPATIPDIFSIRVQPANQTVIVVPEGWEIRARPISLQEAFARSVDPIAAAWVHFDRVSFDGLTSFFAFEIRSPVDGLPPKRFVLNLPLVGAPENRREHVLRMLLNDRDRVLRFLLLLLMDHEARDFGIWLPLASPGHELRSAIHSLFESTLFESLVRALDREPSRIDQVAEIIHDLSQTPEGKKLLPDGLETVWAPIWAVRQQQRAEQRGD